MPLNIDIQQILLHLFNFFILLAGLYLLLYKPVKQFMEKREAYYAEMDAQKKRELAEAESLKASTEERLAGAEEEIRQMRLAATAKVEEQTARRLKESQQEADEILSQARENAKAEQEKLMASARQEIVELAAEAANRMIRQSMEMAKESEHHEG